jgi:hypothetical protein
MKKFGINYSVLKSGDRVLCGGKSPFATITRIVTSGIKDAFNYGVCVHTGLVIDFHGQKLIAEMQPKGLEINSLSRYTTNNGKRFILDIARSPVIDLDDNRKKLEELIALYRRKTIEYDYIGLFEFIFKKVNDSKSKNYCSEFDYMVTKAVGCHYPDKFKIKVSPKDLQELGTWKSIDGWKI